MFQLLGTDGSILVLCRSSGVAYRKTEKGSSMMTGADCPFCGEELHIRIWEDDYGIVEIHKSCPCGYIYHWAYGNVVEDSEREVPQ